MPDDPPIERRPIAQRVRFHRRTVTRYIQRYEAEGCNGLLAKPLCRRVPKATAAYTTGLLQTVAQEPRAHELPFSNWTTAALAEYMAPQTGIELSARQVENILKTNGWRLRRPVRTVKHKQDPALVEVVTGRRVHIVHSRRNNIGLRCLLAAFSRTFALAEQPQCKVVLFLDNDRAYHAKPVHKLLASYEGCLQIEWLPAYSPEMNPQLSNVRGLNLTGIYRLIMSPCPALPGLSCPSRVLRKASAKGCCAQRQRPEPRSLGKGLHGCFTDGIGDSSLLADALWVLRSLRQAQDRRSEWHLKAYLQKRRIRQTRTPYVTKNPQEDIWQHMRRHFTHNHYLGA